MSDNVATNLMYALMEPRFYGKRYKPPKPADEKAKARAEHKRARKAAKLYRVSQTWKS